LGETVEHKEAVKRKTGEKNGGAAIRRAQRDGNAVWKKKIAPLKKKKRRIYCAVAKARYRTGA